MSTGTTDAGMTLPFQKAEATGNATVTQVGRDYNEHHHRYERSWQYLRGVGVDAVELDLAEHAFVDSAGPGGSGQAALAVSRLSRQHERSHTLVLCGEAGTGRRTAALHVLLKAGVHKERIRWLVLDWDQPRTEQIPHTAGHGFILDLTGYSGLDDDFYTGLGDYQKAAQADEAFLVILTDEGSWNPRTLANVPTTHLVRPPAQQVALAHLRHRAGDRVDWLTSPSLDTLLTEASQVSDAARLAGLIAEASEDDRDSIKQQFTDWRKHLEDWFTSHSSEDDLRERALLMAAALLENTPADIVLEAADKLFEEVGGVLPPGGALAGRDLRARLHAIHASVVGEECISLDEERHGLAEAVLKYVWQQRPQLRGVLLEWASQLSAPNGIAVRHLGRIADRLVQLSLLPGGSTVQTVMSGWIETGRTGHRQLAIGVLETMALHPDTGPGVRRWLYDWAKQKTVSRELVSAVAEICAGRLGQKYPRIALTRLRVLASRDDGLASEAVADAVRALANVPEQRILVLSEIIQWAESPESTTRKAGASTFLALTDITDTALLPSAQEPAGDPTAELIDQLFIRGWRAALEEPSTAAEAHARLAEWLDSPALPDTLLMPITAAVLRGHLHEAGAASILVGTSSTSDLGRTRRRKLFRRLIDEQTLSPAASDSDAGGDTYPAQP
ncbi:MULTISPECIES: hypothetical protein [Streptomyces]|uniref:ATP-binding protein n=1 Tax=Streptomyces sudanensis TaxID=436397 RepID=A0ABY4TI13_9ACTN|nr:MULTISPECIES: hypothetical protein [Streptomyces]MCP9956071.1 hypothetical protein [Streptomyces sudanensis]MCQ0003262.1 hypothetical protein [Streptomyces sudanensis]URN18559.1 hypothetical protein MW084_24285 [Streptomyces sudanensis]